MAGPDFNQPVNVRDNNGRFSIRLNPNDATLAVGVDENSGDIVLRDANGRTVIHLNAAAATFFDGGGRRAFNLEMGTAAFSVGAAGNSGDVVIQDGNGQTTVRVDAGTATLSVGAVGNSGDIVLLDGNGQTTIHLDAGQGDIQLLGADCAEEFDVDERQELDPGTVMAIGNEGKLVRCAEAYDKRVAGVISGAGGYGSGIVLDKRPTRDERVPLALSGKVYCKADARHAAIGVGDLLTTSSALGHAMKAIDPSKAFGAVIGKALEPLSGGRGLIPIIVALQ